MKKTFFLLILLWIAQSAYTQNPKIFVSTGGAYKLDNMEVFAEAGCELNNFLFSLRGYSGDFCVNLNLGYKFFQRENLFAYAGASVGTTREKSLQDNIFFKKDIIYGGATTGLSVKLINIFSVFCELGADYKQDKVYISPLLGLRSSF